MKSYKKSILSVLMMLSLVFGMIAPSVSAAGMLNYQTIVGTTWHGEYISTYRNSSKTWQCIMNMTVDSCDADGNFYATCYQTAVKGQGDDDLWAKQRMKGNINFATGDFYMIGDKILSSDKSHTWHTDPAYIGTIDDDGITGLYNGKHNFYYARTSDWAMDEVTEANSYGLIPNTLRNKDLRQNITRAEFAAVSVGLYEKLTNTEITPYSGDQLIDIEGNANETAIRKAYAVNIAVGTSDTLFEPDANLNREQMATMLTRVIKKYCDSNWTLETDGDYYLDTSGTKKFYDDEQISDWAKPSVYYMFKMGIIKGIDDLPTFAPRNITSEQTANGYADSTREQAILLAMRIYKISDILK